MTKQKTCRVCHQTKDIDDFYRHAAHRDGHFSQCKACANAYAKARRERDIEAARAKARSVYQARKAAKALGEA